VILVVVGVSILALKVHGGLFLLDHELVNDLLSLGVSLLREVVHRLVDGEVHVIHADAIGRHSVSLVKVDDVSNDKLSHRDASHSPVGTSVHLDFLVVDLILEFQILPLLDPVAKSADQSSEQQPRVNRERLNVGSRALREDTEEQVDCRSPDQDDRVGIFELSCQQVEERLYFGKSNRVLAEEAVSALNVLLVANDTSVLVRVQQHAEACVVATVPQDVQTDPTLSCVLGLLDILSLEEKLQIFRGKLEDALAGHRWLLGVAAKLGDAD